MRIAGSSCEVVDIVTIGENLFCEALVSLIKRCPCLLAHMDKDEVSLPMSMSTSIRTYARLGLYFLPSAAD